MSETNSNDVSDGVVNMDNPVGVVDQADEIERLKARLAEAEANTARVAETDELAIEREVRNGYSKAELNGQVVLVPPLSKWKSSALKAMNSGDFETWAERTLDDDGWEVWQDADPSIEEIDAFFGMVDMGVDRGNSRGSRRSSRNTGRR